MNMIVSIFQYDITRSLYGLLLRGLSNFFIFLPADGLGLFLFCAIISEDLMNILAMSPRAHIEEFL